MSKWIYSWNVYEFLQKFFMSGERGDGYLFGKWYVLEIHRPPPPPLESESMPCKVVRFGLHVNWNPFDIIMCRINDQTLYNMLFTWVSKFEAKKVINDVYFPNIRNYSKCIHNFFLIGSGDREPWRLWFHPPDLCRLERPQGGCFSTLCVRRRHRRLVSLILVPLE